LIGPPNHFLFRGAFFMAEGRPFRDNGGKAVRHPGAPPASCKGRAGANPIEGQFR